MKFQTWGEYYKPQNPGGEGPMTYKCRRCGANNKIVNQCGCDPNNLPTRPKVNPKRINIKLIAISDRWGKICYVTEEDLASNKQQLPLYTHAGRRFSEISSKLKNGDSITIHRSNIAK